MGDDGEGREIGQTRQRVKVGALKFGNRSNENGTHVMGGAEMMSNVALLLGSLGPRASWAASKQQQQQQQHGTGRPGRPGYLYVPRYIPP